MSLKDFILLSFYAMVRQLAPGMAFSIAVLILAGLLDHWWHKGKRKVGELLNTPQSKETQKMEGNTTFDFPHDENRKRKMCPFCGELYPCSMFRCIYDGYDLVERPKPITEPLPVITNDIKELKADLQRQLGLISAQESEIPDDIKEVWEELELTAEYYNRGKRCRFTHEEVLKLCALETKWNGIKQQERRAS